MERETDGYWYGGDDGRNSTSTLTPKTEIRKKKISALQDIMKKNDRPINRLVRKLKFWR